MRKRCFAIFMAVMMLLGCFGLQVAAAEEAKAPVTWDPSTISMPGATILSGSDKSRITFNNSTGECVAATEYKTEGKWYWENTVSGGIRNEPTIYSGVTYNTGQYMTMTYSFNSRSIPCKPGDVVGVALDMEEYVISFYINGVFQKSTSMNPVFKQFYAAVHGHTVTNISSTVVTNFGAYPFKYDVPEGFRPYDESGTWFYMPNLQVTDIGLYAVELQWNGIIDADYYEVEYDDGVLTTTATEMLVSGLLPKTLYTFRVRAVVDGEPGIWSNVVEARTLGYGGDLDIISISYISSTADSVLLKWEDKPDAEVYEIMCGSVLYTSNTNEILIDGLEPDTEYTFKVRACNTVYEGDWCAELTTRTKDGNGGVPGPQPSSNLALNAAAYSDSVTNRYEAGLAIDGDPDTRWLSDAGATSCFLEIDFGRDVSFNRIVIEEFENRIDAYELLAWEGGSWTVIDSGYGIGSGFTVGFPTVTASKIRLDILSTRYTRPSIYEFEVYHD